MDRVVIVTKPTRLEELVRERLTLGAARFVLESRGQSIEPYLAEDAADQAALDEVRRQIPSDLPTATVSRAGLPNFLFRERDLIVVCGPDGLFVNLAKYVGDQPILSVNPDPRTVAGALMRFAPREVGEVVRRTLQEKHRIERLPLAKATVDGDRVLWGASDLFIGRRDHVSARYEISFGGARERHSSSGIIVATGIGATGWIRSVAAMVTSISGSASHALARLPAPSDEVLVFVAREPFPSPSTGTRIVTGRVTPGSPLSLTSEMPDGGYLFSDGIVEKAIEWEAGSTVTVTVGERYVSRIVQ